MVAPCCYPSWPLPPYALGCHKGSEGLAPSLGFGDQWVATEAQGMPSIVLMAVYMDDTIGATGSNLNRLNQIVSFTKARKKLVVAGGDWNMPPDVLMAT